MILKIGIIKMILITVKRKINLSNIKYTLLIDILMFQNLMKLKKHIIKIMF